MDFAFLWYFLAPAVLLPFVVWYFQKPLTEQKAERALCVPFFKVLQEGAFFSTTLSYNGLAFIFFMAWLALIVALMRPVSYGDGFLMPTKARQMMLVLDASGSMAEQDFVLNHKRMTRMGAVKTLADDFLQGRQGDAVGLTIFGTESYVYVPLTLDIKTAREMLSETGVGIAGERTAIGDALGLALKEMKDIPSQNKVIILLSDGFANAGIVRPEEAVKIAKEMDVKIYTIGLGSDKKKIESFFFVQEVNPSAELDEEMLQKIAAETGGKYFRVKTSADLKRVYDELDKLEPVEDKGVLIRPQTDLFWWPLGVSMALFFLGFYLKERRV